VVVLVPPDNGRTRTLCLAVCLGAPVVNNSVKRF
jgi:(2Fe-2S) ferredoxin